MAKKLPKAARDKIYAAVDALFDKMKLRFIGPQSVSKRLYISFLRPVSLPGMYEAAHLEEGGVPDREHLDQLLHTASNYIEALRHKTKAQTVVAVQNYMHDVSKHRRRGAQPPSLHTVLGGELSDVYAKVKSDVRRIIDTETQTVRNVGTLEGITRANASLGIEDPVVFWVVVRDHHLCGECRRLHLMPDGKTPRVWRMSEIGHDYHRRGEEQPKVAGLHPHCRCSMTTLMPGFGFNDAGMVTWVREGHDELARQRGVSKSSGDESLKKGARGDWRSEGYEIRHEASGDGRSVAVRAYLNGQVVGDLDAGHSSAVPGTLFPSNVTVHHEHKRKGIATAMYQRAEEVLGAKFRRGSYQSPDAKKFWSQRNRPFGGSD